MFIGRKTYSNDIFIRKTFTSLFCFAFALLFFGLNLNDIKYRQKYINTCNPFREHHVYLSKLCCHLSGCRMTVV